ncbi:hypothetical protein [Mesorhizobium sp.]|uniref:hypothetical protein n=1 Tax=Mesorhizobium sp. TaxID=1871066 RepID=UPI0011FEDABF|nr:hypothetical protein [Mesorhizobium sp.]TIL31924.1 MAG: hypothetical protein E5Y82_29385 [Mesorhizobium sp.]
MQLYVVQLLWVGSAVRAVAEVHRQQVFLKEAGIAGAGGSLKDLVSTRPRETDADGAGLFEEADVADDELVAPLAGIPKA